MNRETLHSSFEPILRYQEFLSEEPFGREQSSITIRPIDAFVMKQLMSSVPKKATVVDFSAEETRGASSVFWAANEEIEQVFVAQPRERPPVWEKYVHSLRNKKDVALHLTALQFVEGSSDASVLAQVIQESAKNSPSLVFHVSTSEKAPGEFVSRIRELIQLGQRPLFVLSAFGRTGACPALKSIGRIQDEHPDYDFSLVREISPFLAQSSLGLLFPKQMSDLPGILKRIGQLFEGNFDYVNLLKDHLALTLEHKRLDAKYHALSQARPKEVPVFLPMPTPEPEVVVPDPNLIPISAPPEPLFFARFLRGCYRTLLPSRARESLAKSRGRQFQGLRRHYHERVPLLYRIVLRDIRVLFLGR